MPALLQHARTEKRYLFKSREELIARSQAALARAKARMHDWFGLLPKADVVIQRYPKFREKNGPNEYNPPAEDGSRPAVFFINAYRPRRRAASRPSRPRSTRRFRAITCRARSRSSGRAFIRSAATSGTPATSEGWALYAERLADEMKLYSIGSRSPRHALEPGAARRRGWSSIPGIHTMGWTRQQAIDFMLAHTAEDPADVVSEVDRYIIYPGQATAYMLGKLGDQQGARRGAADDGRGSSTSRASTIACSRTAPSRSASCTQKITGVGGAMTRRWTGACVLAARVLAAAPLRRRCGGAAAGGRPSAAFDVQEKTIAELQAALTAGTVTSRSLVLAYLARIRAYDLHGPRLNAMIAMNPQVLEIADALDRERAAGRVRGPLHGIPIVVKDNFETADMPTTGGSLALTGFMTGRDAFQVKRLRDAGAVIIGKTNLHELAAGITTISSLGGQTRNPYDPTRNPGGSSGGTGAAVAASFAAAGMGSDTCGSIRIPVGQQQPVRPARHDGAVEPRRHHPAVAHARTSAARWRAPSPIWR